MKVVLEISLHYEIFFAFALMLIALYLKYRENINFYNTTNVYFKIYVTFA